LGIALALGAVGAFGVTAAGCGGQSDNPIGDADAGAGSDTGTTLDSGGGGSDSGGDSTVGVQDSGGDGSVIADGGSDGNESIGDSGHEAGLDAGFDADADTGVPPLADAKLVLVHAAPGLGPVRFCLATSVGTAESVVAPISALPHGPLSAPSYPPPPAFGSEYDGGSAPVAQGTPGLYPGTIAALPDITSLDAFAITFILIDANAIANNTAAGSPDGGPELTCQQLLGTHAKGTTDSPVAGTLTPSQFIVLPAIPPGTFPDGSTSLLSFTGCVAGYEPSAAARAQGTTATDICGADFGSSGNVAVGVAPIDTTSAPTSGGWGVQFAHRSTAIQGTPVPIVAGGTPTGIVHKAASAGLLPQITASGDLIALAASPVQTSGTQITPYTTVTADPTTSGFGVLTAPGSLADGGEEPLPWPVSFQTIGGVQTAVLGDLLGLSLGGIEALSAWQLSTADGGSPSGFAAGNGYTLVFVGSIDAPQLANPDGGVDVNPTYDGRGLHVVAFPNRFAPILLQ